MVNQASPAFSLQIFSFLCHAFPFSLIDLWLFNLIQVLIFSFGEKPHTNIWIICMNLMFY